MVSMSHHIGPNRIVQPIYVSVVICTIVPSSHTKDFLN